MPISPKELEEKLKNEIQATHLMDGVLSAAVALVFLWGSVVGGAKDDTFESRFEYEYKVLQKLIVLEIEKTELRGMVTALETRLEEAETVMRALNATVRDVAIGSTYIRWGRKTCPTETGAQPLYDGFVGGTWYAHSGGGNTYLCLPRDPVLKDLKGGERSYIYGAEYQVSGTIWNEMHDNDVPCVVCITPNTNVVMVPAKNVCHPGWTLEYKGYLMTEKSTHNSKNYVCMDDKPEDIDGSRGDQNGALFYFVEASCGSLPCDPYIQGHELTCAVCSLPLVN